MCLLAGRQCSTLGCSSLTNQICLIKCPQLLEGISDLSSTNDLTDRIPKGPFQVVFFNFFSTCAHSTQGSALFGVRAGPRIGASPSC